MDKPRASVIRSGASCFPGVLIQGDSLSVIRSDVANIRDACRTEGATEALELAEVLLEDVDAIMLRYADTLERHGLRKPF
jgi:hypothetical protein